MRCWSFRGILLASASLAAAGPVSSTNTRHVEEQDGVTFNVFHHGPTDSKLRYVNDSGICETTPGVHQRSGYASVGKDMNMFFWHFDARKNPETAPLVMIFNGGPGGASSSLPFIVNGPCSFADASSITQEDIDSLIGLKPEVNAKSFNEFASLLYVDQPLSTGFSYGQNFINSTDVAASTLWTFLQAFLADFQSFRDRHLAILGVSYGGRTAPALASVILERNAAIQSGDPSGIHINLTAVGLINAWMDAETQVKDNIHYALKNDYHPIIKSSLHGQFDHAYEKNFLPKVRACKDSGTVDACCDASASYLEEIAFPILSSSQLEGYDLMYLAKPANESEDTGLFEEYLRRPDVRKALGAKRVWDGTGGNMRSAIPNITTVLDNDVDVVIFTGDADCVCSWPGTLNVADALPLAHRAEFRDRKLERYDVDGVQKGAYKTVKNLSFIKVAGAGHNVPFYKPDVAVQIVKQMLSGKVTST